MGKYEGLMLVLIILLQRPAVAEYFLAGWHYGVFCQTT